MLASQFFFATLRETPTDAEITSHQLMLRAGMIRKLASGLYTWLPLGLRVLRKIENIVREEMVKAGALEILMPAVQPAELWEETGRWEKFGSELLKLKDRHQREFCFGPTHEEIITDLARRDIRSYKQLPINIFQIQNKFRDEIRPRFGVMRAREFLMKDAYSFHLNNQSLQESYDAMYQTYSQIFSRMGLKFRAVLADTGAIGGSFSHEFQVLAESGEDILVYSDSSDYAANIERAEALAPSQALAKPTGEMKKIHTPGMKTIKALDDALNIPPTQSVKTLIVKGSETPLVALIIRGDHELNPLKAQKLPEVFSPLTFVHEEEVKEIIGSTFGSLGPVNINIPYIVDRDAALVNDFVCGANIEDYHFTHVNWGRDLPLTKVADLRLVVEGDLSPDGKGKLKFARGIEVGHIFQLGDKYCRAMNMTVLDESGKAIFPKMGCYGIGVSRLVAAAIEQHHDQQGIIWPEPIAPFDMVIVPIQMQKSERVRHAAEKLYRDLQAAGYDVLLDDRNERLGVILADLDLIGIPHRIVIGDRGLEQGTVEYKSRASGEVSNWPIDKVIGELKKSGTAVYS